MTFAIGHQPIRMTVDVELGQDPRGPPAVRDSKVAGWLSDWESLMSRGRRWGLAKLMPTGKVINVDQM